MKRKRFPALFTAALIVLGVAKMASAVPAVIERGPHHRVWQNITPTTNELGQVTLQTNRWTELQDGLHYLQNGQWLESQALIEPHPQGAVAQQLAYKVIFNRNINTDGSVDLLTPDQKRLRGHVLGLRWKDAVTGNTVVFAQVKDSLGEILPPNQIIWRDAFVGTRADMRYTCQKGFFEGDIILRENPPLPAGWDPANARLELVTEFLDPPLPQINQQVMKRESDPVKRAQMAEPDLINQDLNFGAMRMIMGKAFEFDEQAEVRGPVQSGVRVAKQWLQQPGGAYYLIEAIDYLAVKPFLDQLPVAQAAKKQETERLVLARQSRLRSEPASNQGGEMKLAQQGAGPSGRGFVIDAPTVYSGTDQTFSENETYHITGGVGFSGTVTIQGGTVVKYDRNTYLYMYGTVSCQTANNFATFTAVDDHTTGEKIGSGTLSGYYATQALWVYYVTVPFAFQRVHIAHATYGVYLDANPGVSVTHQVLESSFQHCQTGLYANTANAYMANTFMCDVGTQTWGVNGATITTAYITTRCEPLVNDPGLDTALVPSPNRKQNESSLVLCGPASSRASNIVVGYNDGSTTGKLTGLSRSTDSGTNFTDLGSLPSGTEGNGSDPTLAFEKESGTYAAGIVYYVANPGSNQNRFRQFRSNDRGLSWTSYFPVVNIGDGYFLADDALDKPWIAVDNASGVGEGYAYLVFLNNWTYGSTCPNGPCQRKDRGVYFLRSVDHGYNWYTTSLHQFTPTDDSREYVPFITVGQNHHLYVLYYEKNSSSRSIKFWKSDTEGDLWTQLTSPPNLRSPGGYGPKNAFLNIYKSNTDSTVVRNVCFPQAAVHPTRNDVYLVYPDQSATAGDKADIFFRKYDSAAGTWGDEVRVNNPSSSANDNDQWSPVIALKPNGTQLFVGYYDRSADANNTLIHVSGRIASIDGNGNVSPFGSEIQISAANFPIVDPSYGEADYDMAVADDGAFYYTWSDNRNRMRTTAPDPSPSLQANEANVRFTKIPAP